MPHVYNSGITYGPGFIAVLIVNVTTNPRFLWEHGHRWVFRFSTLVSIAQELESMNYKAVEKLVNKSVERLIEPTVPTPGEKGSLHCF